MAKFIVTKNTSFDPFTYDEVSKPLVQMQEAHNAAADAYDTLSLETNALAHYITENEDDGQARSMYNAYKQALSNLQEDLYTNGFSQDTRRNLAKVRAGYASDITRLKKAIEDRQTRSKEYWDMRHKNPDLVMGTDPGMGGLDNYLTDPNYGRDYYTYSGNTFTAEVAADAKARASEMLRMPQYAKDPAAVGYLTQITQKGFTSGEVNSAADAVRRSLAGDNSGMRNLTPASRILADVLTTHLASTGANGIISADEYNRLFDYGVVGLSQAIGGTNVQNLTDKQWDFSKQMAMKQWDYNKQKELLAMQGKLPGASSEESTTAVPIDLTIRNVTDTQNPVGIHYDKAAKDLAFFVAEGNRKPIVGNKMNVASKKDAAKLVFSEDLRNGYKIKLGFDIGMEVPGALSRDSAFDKLTGTIVRNGVEYETRYSPKAMIGDKQGAVLYREKGSGTPWELANIDEELTNTYKEGRRKFEEVRDYYKKNEPAIYMAASYMTPDRLDDLRREYNVDSSVGLDGLTEAVFSQDEYAASLTRKSFVVAEDGTDAGKLNSRLYGLSKSAQITLSDDELSTMTGNSRGIHKLSPQHNLGKKALQFSDIYTKYKTNGSGNAGAEDINGGIKRTAISLSGVNAEFPYIIQVTDKGTFAVSIDMYNNDQLINLFDQAKDDINKLEAIEADKETKQLYIDKILDNLTTDMANALGYDQSTTSRSGSSKEFLRQ